MDLIGAEIFDVGTWNGLEFTDDDLDAIVAAFESLNAYHHVPLKLGHNEDQPVTDGQPALGWVNRIYRQGSKLLADFTNMPRAIYDAVKNKLYRTVSVELLGDVSYKGDAYPWVLDAVALLGADQPAVNTLSDLNALMASRTNFSDVGRRLSFTVSEGDRNQHDDGGTNMADLEKQVSDLRESLEGLRADLSSAQDELKATRQERDELKAKTADFERLEKERADAERAAAVTDKREKVSDLFTRAVKAGSITPAQRESFSKLFKLDDEDKLLDLDLDTLAETINAPKADMDRTRNDVPDPRDSTESAEDFLMRKTRESMAETGEDNFAKAFHRVAQAHPKMHREYLTVNGS